MKKNTLLKAMAVLSSAIMTASTMAMSVMGASEDEISLTLHDQKVYAGATVEIPLTMQTGNQCTSYDMLIEFDSNFEYVSTSGARASESFETDNKKYVTLVGYDTAPYKDGAIIASIKLYVPPTVEYDDYSVSFSQISGFSGDDQDITDYTTYDATVSVVPFVSMYKKGVSEKGRIAEKHSEHKIFQKFDKDGKLADASVGYRGDANNDGKASIKDAADIAKAIAGRRVDKMSDKDAFFADVNDDGKITIKDAALIAIFIAKGKTSWDDILK